jgi:hypothetical protein
MPPMKGYLFEVKVKCKKDYRNPYIGGKAYKNKGKQVLTIYEKNKTAFRASFIL